MLYGLWIVTNSTKYFIRNWNHAAEEHQEMAKEAISLASDSSSTPVLSRDGVEFLPVLRREDVPPFLVMRDQFGIFVTRWSPETPRELEVDHKGNRSFEIIDFASDYHEAESIVNLHNHLEQ